VENQKRASIDMDEIRKKNLGEVSAADFMEALNLSGGTAIRHFNIWPEKKKYELWSEPEHNINVGKVFDFLNEKKKRELEKPPLYEGVFDPASLIRDPDFIQQVAMEVTKQLKTQV